jgi:hypothetical protein
MNRERELLKKASLMLMGVQLLDGVWNSNCGNFAKEIDMFLKSPTKPIPAPDAWKYEDENDGRVILTTDISNKINQSSWNPLYLSPPYREPLSDEHIDELLDSEDADSGGSHRFARAIEKARGIE